MGSYIDLDGNKYEGEIKMNKTMWGSLDMLTPSYITIKEGDEKKRKIEASEIKSLVIEKDSFIVRKNVTLRRKDLANQSIMVKADFFRKIIDGKIKVYRALAYNAPSRDLLINEYAIKDDSKPKPLRDSYTSSINESSVLKLIIDDKELYQKWKRERNSKIRKEYLLMLEEYNSRNK